MVGEGGMKRADWASRLDTRCKRMRSVCLFWTQPPWKLNLSDRGVRVPGQGGGRRRGTVGLTEFLTEAAKKGRDMARSAAAVGRRARLGNRVYACSAVHRHAQWGRTVSTHEGRGWRRRVTVLGSLGRARDVLAVVVVGSGIPHVQVTRGRARGASRV